MPLSQRHGVAVMKDKINNIKRIFFDKKGVLIVESAIVFPVMFFVLFFIIFIGNMYYEQARVDDIVMRNAIKGSQCVADPFLYDMVATSAVPTDVDTLRLEPYRYILGSFTDGSISAVEKKISNAVIEEINSGTLIFFSNSKARYVGTDNGSVAKFNNKIIYSSFVVQVNYEIKFPINFLGYDDLTLIKLSSRAEVPINDTDEFIRNVDMAVDLLEDTGVGKTISSIFDKIGGFINSFASK